MTERGHGGGARDARGASGAGGDADDAGRLVTSDDPRAPLVIGVTGHREIPDRERVRTLLREHVFGVLLARDHDQGRGRDRTPKRPDWKDGDVPDRCPRERFPAWPLRNTPLVLLTALADGTDTLVADVALELNDELRGDGTDPIRIVPVLPMPADEYEKTLEKKSTRETFARVLAAARGRVFEMPLPADPRALSRPDEVGESARKIQYALAGLFIARWSRLLIAVWNGDDFPVEPSEKHEKRGGTSHVVHMALTGRVDDPVVLSHLDEIAKRRAEASSRMLGAGESLIDLLEPAPVIWIPTAAGGDGSVVFRRPTDFVAHASEFDRYLAEVFRRSTAFNEAVASVRERDETSTGSGGSTTAGTSAAAGDGSSSGADDPSAAGMAYRCHRAADHLAGRYQCWARRSRIVVHVLVGAAAAAFLMYAHLVRSGEHEVMSIWLGLDILLLTAAYFVFGEAGRRRLEQRHWDYRALAEGLRVMVPWRAAGLARPVTQFYLRRQRNELDWIPFAMDGVTILEGPIDPARSTGDTRAHTALAKWIGGQYGYYRDAWRLRKLEHVRFEAASAALLLVSVVAMGTVLLVDWHGGAWDLAFAAGVVVLLVVARCRGTSALSWFTELWDERSEHAEFRALEIEKRSGGTRKVDPERLGLVDSLLTPLGVTAWTLTAATSLIALIVLVGPMLPTVTCNGHHLGVAAIVVPAVVAAVLHSYSAQRAAGAEQGRYRKMAGVYGRALSAFAEVARDQAQSSATERDRDPQAHVARLLASIDGSHADLTAGVLEAVGEESLSEHAEWVMLHRDHPLDLPHAQ